MSLGFLFILLCHPTHSESPVFHQQVLIQVLLSNGSPSLKVSVNRERQISFKCQLCFEKKVHFKGIEASIEGSSSVQPPTIL